MGSYEKGFLKLILHVIAYAVILEISLTKKKKKKK